MGLRGGVYAAKLTPGEHFERLVFFGAVCTDFLDFSL